MSVVPLLYVAYWKSVRECMIQVLRSFGWMWLNVAFWVENKVVYRLVHEHKLVRMHLCHFVNQCPMSVKAIIRVHICKISCIVLHKTLKSQHMQGCHSHKVKMASSRRLYSTDEPDFGTKKSWSMLVKIEFYKVSRIVGQTCVDTLPVCTMHCCLKQNNALNLHRLLFKNGHNPVLSQMLVQFKWELHQGTSSKCTYYLNNIRKPTALTTNLTKEGTLLYPKNSARKYGHIPLYSNTLQMHLHATWQVPGWSNCKGFCGGMTRLQILRNKNLAIYLTWADKTAHMQIAIIITSPRVPHQFM